MSNFEANWLQQQKTTPSTTPVSQEHHSSHTKMIEQKTGKTFSVLISLNFCCEIWTVGSELGINNIKANPSCLVSIVRAGSEGEIVWWIFSRHTLDPSAPTERQMKKMYVIGSVLHLFYPHSSNLHTGPASQTTVLTVHLLVGIGNPIIANKVLIQQFFRNASHPARKPQYETEAF